MSAQKGVSFGTADITFAIQASYGGERFQNAVLYRVICDAMGELGGGGG